MAEKKHAISLLRAWAVHATDEFASRHGRDIRKGECREKTAKARVKVVSPLCGGETNDWRDLKKGTLHVTNSRE